uniref:EF-hand domain-containing protein n=1 Tax=Panagrolaimus sp. ES5 TaxID=591445 RepID=A0AC34GSR6_9BILA
MSSARRNSQQLQTAEKDGGHGIGRRASQSGPDGFGTHEIHVRQLMNKNPDVDPYLILKWEKIFTLTFDQNASHEIDWSDFYICLRKIREIYGDKSKRMEYARKSLEALWEGLQKLADTKGDAPNHDLVTIEEWITILKKSNAKEKTGPKWFTDYMTFMFKLFNVSEGGWDMNIDEYSDGMAVYGHGLQEAHQAFHKFAIDKDGKQKDYISFEEWKKLFSDLFFSSNEHDLGNYLFGDLNVKCHTIQRNYCASRPQSSETS